MVQFRPVPDGQCLQRRRPTDEIQVQKHNNGLTNEYTNLNVHHFVNTVACYLDAALFLPFIKRLELTFFLPIVHRANNNLMQIIKLRERLHK